MANALQRTSPLDLASLECHFLWQPEKASTKTNIDQVIERVQMHNLSDPKMSVAYLTTLCYLSTLPPFPNISKAEQFLAEAEQVSADVEHWQHSGFIVSAIRLHIRQIRRGRPLRRQEIAGDLSELTNQWEGNANTRATVYGIKGAALRFFGPKKYKEGAEAYRLALELQPENFRWLWGGAYLLARDARQGKVFELPQCHLSLWSRADEISRENRDPSFCANYAEALLGDRNRSVLCEQLMDEAIELMKQLDRDEMGKHSVVFIIGLKVYRKLRLFPKYHQLLELTQSIERCCKDAGFYLEISKQHMRNRDRQKALEALRNGKKSAMHPGHHWIDLELVELEAADVGTENTLRAFDSLLTSNYRVYDRVVACIRLRKAFFLFKNRLREEGMDECLLAFETFPDAGQNIENYRIREMLKVIEDWPEHEAHEAWFRNNILSYIQSSQPNHIEDLFHKGLVRNRRNYFAWEHLGKFYLNQQKYQLAFDCFCQIPDNPEMSNCRDDLLTEAILKNPQADLTSIEMCLSFGRCEASLRVFEFFENSKTDLVNRVVKMVDDFDSRSSRDSSRLFFSRRVYELCARAQNLAEDCDSNETNKLRLVENVRERVRNLLELGSLSTAAAAAATSSAADSDRGNLMRQARLEAARLYCLGRESTEECCNKIVETLKESKELLDRSFAYQFRSAETAEFSYVHAFDQIKSKLKSDPEYNKELGKAKSKADKKVLEAKALMEAIRKKPKLRTLEELRDCLHDGVKKVDANFRYAKATSWKFDFLAKREHRILENENRWILRWIYGVNMEKHKVELSVRDLEQSLATDWSGWDGCQTAYDLANLAAEFAEETWLILGPERVERDVEVRCELEQPTEESEDSDIDELSTDFDAFFQLPDV